MILNNIGKSLSFAALVAASGPAIGQEYPAKPIRIVTSQPASGNDIVARIMGQAVSGNVGQPVIVDNRASAVIAGEVVARAPADGYTLLYYGNSLWLLPLMRSVVPYDMQRDFAPVTLAVSAPSILASHPSLPVKSVRELIALAKSRPGQLNDGSPAVGTATHLASELFKFMADVKIVRVPYKGGGAAANDLLAGHLHLAFVVNTVASPLVKSGRIRALGITSSEPSPQFPELPTIASAGLPGYESLAQAGMLAPARTPEAIVRRLNQEFVRALNQTDIKDRILATGSDTVASTPDQFAAKIKSEITRWAEVIRKAGIRDE